MDNTDNPLALAAEQFRLWSRIGLRYLPRIDFPEPPPEEPEQPESAPPAKTTSPNSRKEHSAVSENPPLPISPPSGNWDTLSAARSEAQSCHGCTLANTRQTVVFGEGDPHARLMFVGEAPGRDEDEQGLPFVGRSGKLLTKMIEAMGLSREEVYIANVLKCRPPNNRDPRPDEAAACRPYLEAQIRLIAPEIIVCLGRHAAIRLLGMERPLRAMRGTFHHYKDNKQTRIAVTYHPAYCLRNPASKKDVWEDLKKVLAELGMPVPK